MRRTVKPCLWILFSLCFIWIPLNLALAAAAPEYGLLIGTWGSFPFIQRMLNIIALLSGTALAVLHYRGTDRRIVERILLVLTGLGLLILTIYSNVLLLILDDTEYHSFTSPDSAHTIVVGERSFFLAGGVTVYERVNPFLVKIKGHALTDDGFRPICSGAYELVWYEDGVVVSFSNGAGRYEQISVRF